MGPKYTNYSDALKELNLQTLDERRQSLCVKFAKKCLETEKLSLKMFPLNRKVHHMRKRDNERYLVSKSFTERHRKSVIPYMQKQKIMRQISSTYMPVNNGLC